MSPREKKKILSTLAQTTVLKSDGKITDDQLSLINSMKTNGPKTKLSKDEIYVRSMIIMGEEPTSRMSIHPEGKLNGKSVNILSQLQELSVGAPMLIGHNFDTAPWGRIFHSEKMSNVEGYTGEVLKIWYYFLKNEEGDQFAEKIDSGIYSEGSISYQYGEPLCSICHGRVGYSFFSDSDTKKCKEHQIGETYKIDNKDQICYYYPSKIDSVLEVSFVFRGAYKKTQAGYSEKFSSEFKEGYANEAQLLSEHSVDNECIDLDNLDESEKNEKQESKKENKTDGKTKEENSKEQSEDSKEVNVNQSDNGENCDNVDESGNLPPKSSDSKNSTTKLSLPGKLLIMENGEKVFRLDDIVLSEATENSDSGEETSKETLEDTSDENSDNEASEETNDSEDNSKTEDIVDETEEVDESIEEETEEDSGDVSENSYTINSCKRNGQSFYSLRITGENEISLTLLHELSFKNNSRVHAIENNDSTELACGSLVKTGKAEVLRTEDGFVELKLDDAIFYLTESKFSIRGNRAKTASHNGFKSGKINLLHKAQNQEKDSIEIYGDNYPKVSYYQINNSTMYDVEE